MSTEQPPSSNPPPKKKLFRQEAIDNYTVKIYGNVVLLNPISTTLLAYLFLGIAILLVVFFFTFSYQRNIKVMGVLLPDTGLIKVINTQSGTLIRTNIQEGQHVSKDDVLFILNNDKEATNLGEASKKATSLLMQRQDALQEDIVQVQKQYRQKIEGINQKLMRLRQDVTRITSQIHIQKQKIALAETTYLQHLDLYKKNYLSLAAVRAKETDFLDQKQRLSDIESSLSFTQKEILDSQLLLDDFNVQSTREQASVERMRSTTEQEILANESNRQFIIRAQTSGIISSHHNDVGQNIAAGTPLGTIVPDNSRLQVHLMVPTSSVGFLKKGMTVIIRYQSFPYQKYGQHQGKIIDISNTTLTSESNIPQSANSEPFYKVRVQLEQQTIKALGIEQPLKSGMLLDASILTETRRLYEWALEPLYSITGRL